MALFHRLIALVLLTCVSISQADDDHSESIVEEARETAEARKSDSLGADISKDGISEADIRPAISATESVESLPSVVEPEPSLPPLPQAENVNLKEVISKPLQEALPQVQPIAPDPAPVVASPAAPVESASSQPEVSPSTEAAPESSATSEMPAAQPTAVTPPVQPVAPVQPAVEPLRMLGAEVLPGTTTRLAWSVKDSLAGISVPTPVLVVHGKLPGPKLCLTAALHGDELNGIEMVRRVMYDLQADKLSGTVIGVPIVNLQGFRRASRYLPDRRDLNRYFPGHPNGSSAARIANSFFTEVVMHCDLLLDLHTGSFRRTNLPQLRADLTTPSVTDLSQKMGPIVVLHSRGAKGSLRRAAVDAGIPAITLEAGEPLHIDQDAVQHGVVSIQGLMHNLQMYPFKSIWARKTEPVYYKSRWIRVPTGGILLSKVRLGERIKRNQLLGSVTDPITNSSSEILSPIEGRVIGMALNQVMLPGYAAYHIGYKATAEDAAETDAGPEDGADDDADVEEGEGFSGGAEGSGLQDLDL